MSLIKISSDILEQAIKHATKRTFESVRKGLKDHIESGDLTYYGRFVQDLEGLLAEYAVTQFLGIKGFVPGINVFHSIADIGKDIEVRSTPSERNKLIVRWNDPPNRKYVFTVVELWRISPWREICPTVKLFGWMYGKDAMKDKYLRDPNQKGKAWWVPKEDLLPIETLSESSNQPTHEKLQPNKRNTPTVLQANRD